jgi:hypothetical protein
LPDGFYTKNDNFGIFSKAMEHFGGFRGHLVLLMPFGVINGHLEFSSRFGVFFSFCFVLPRKI